MPRRLALGWLTWIVLWSIPGIGVLEGTTLRADESARAMIEYIEPLGETGASLAAVVEGADLAHTAQMLPWDRSGRIVGGETARQIVQVLNNVEAALTQAGSSLDRAVKLNFYVVNDQVATDVRKALAKRFSGRVKPAVSFVAGKLADPSAVVAMDAVAACGVDPSAADIPPRVSRLRNGELPAKQPQSSHVAILPAGPRVYIAGQAEPGELRQATRATMESLRRTLEFLDLDLGDVVQVKSFVTPISAAAEAEEEIMRSFGDRPAPPLVFVEWISSLPIEIELVAAAKPGTAAARERVAYLTPPGMTASPVFSRVAGTASDRVIYISSLYGGNAPDGEGRVREIFTTLTSLLGSCGSDLRHLVKATYYAADDDASTKLNELRPSYYDPRRPPAASKAMVQGVGLAGKTITLDMIAVPAGP